MSFVELKLFLKSLFCKINRNKTHAFICELSLILMIGIMIGFNACAKSNNQRESSSSEPCVSISSEKSESIIEDTVKSKIPVVSEKKEETSKAKEVKKRANLSVNQIKKIETVVAARNANPKESSGKPYSNGTPSNTTAIIGSAKTIPMKCILQNPELPTGCEATSLTIVLNYLGYDVSKATIAGEYLPQSTDFHVSNGKKYGPDFTTTFSGNPFTQHGYGCLAPAIVTTANNYLSAHGNGNTTVSNISGSSPTKLYDYVKKSIPVIVWATVGMKQPYQGASWYTPSGRLAQWTSSEHCLVLVGYNNDNVVLNDPLVGTTTYSRQLFETRYAQLGSQAIVITNKSNPSTSGSTPSSSSSSPSSSGKASSGSLSSSSPSSKASFGSLSSSSSSSNASHGSSLSSGS